MALFLLFLLTCFFLSLIAAFQTSTCSSSSRVASNSIVSILSKSKEDTSLEPTHGPDTCTNVDFGLLKGIEVTSASHYTQNLPMKSLQDVEWLSQLGLPWNAVVQDAETRNCTPGEYLKEMKQMMKHFRDSGQIHDREEFYSFLNNALETKGQVSLVLGGKSVGKSLVLNDFNKKLLDQQDGKYLPLLVDGRDFSGSSLADGILESMKEGIWSDEIVLEFLKTIIPDHDDLFAKLVNNPNQSFPKDINYLIESRVLTPSKALERFVETAEFRGKQPVLIVDEANKVVGLGEGPNASSSTLDRIVKHTKQSRRLNVILASSEYDYPHKLQSNGLNLNDIDEKLFTGEIPPKSMWELLVTKKTNMPVIGMGENLARVLIASYGGHFKRVFSALFSLAMKEDEFYVRMRLDPIGQNIMECLKRYPRESLSLLRRMAEFGFAPIDTSYDPVAEMIVRMNIGGIVSEEDSEIVGLRTTVWGGKATCGLVPTSQSARNMIAIQVLHHENEKQWWKGIAFWRRRRRRRD